jgi:hypothetical protein
MYFIFVKKTAYIQKDIDTYIYSSDWPSSPISASVSLSPAPASAPTPYEPATPPPPLRRRAQHATRDDRLLVRTLREIGWLYPTIARYIGLIRYQIKYVSKYPSIF